MAPRTSVGVQIQRRPMIVCPNNQRHPKENFNSIDKRKSRTIPSSFELNSLDFDHRVEGKISEGKIRAMERRCVILLRKYTVIRLT